jgi:ubiquinone/menaquinone biosynthesis C-methylase UbiE
MKTLDRLLQRWRYRVVRPHIPCSCRLLDVGGYDGSFLYFMKSKLVRGICLDPLCRSRREGRFEFLQGTADSRLPLPDACVDVVTLLAVLEHVMEKEALAQEVFRVLRSRGRLVITVPQPVVDRILNILMRLKLIDGMALEEHHQFNPKEVESIFTRHGFSLRKQRRFQLGLNNLFVFEKLH